MVGTKNGNLVDIFTIHLVEFSRAISNSEILTGRFHRFCAIQSQQLKIASSILICANAVVCCIIVLHLMFFTTSSQSFFSLLISCMSKKLKEKLNSHSYKCVLGCLGQDISFFLSNPLLLVIKVLQLELCYSFH